MFVGVFLRVVLREIQVTGEADSLVLSHCFVPELEPKTGFFCSRSTLTRGQFILEFSESGSLSTCQTTWKQDILFPVLFAPLFVAIKMLVQEQNTSLRNVLTLIAGNKLVPFRIFKKYFSTKKRLCCFV